MLFFWGHHGFAWPSQRTSDTVHNIACYFYKYSTLEVQNEGKEEELSALLKDTIVGLLLWYLISLFSTLLDLVFENLGPL